MLQIGHPTNGLQVKLLQFYQLDDLEFYIFRTVRLRIILAGNQLDAQFLL